jgi:hypothetical protein
VREQTADGNPALAVLPELPRRFEQVARRAFGERERAFEGQRFAVVLNQPRLGVESIEMRWPAVHEQENDALGLGGKMRRLGPVLAMQKARQPNHAKSAGGATK